MYASWRHAAADISNVACQQGAVASRLTDSPSYTDAYPGIRSSDIEAYKYSRRLVQIRDLNLISFWLVYGQSYCKRCFLATGLSHRELSGSCDGVLQWGWHAWVCCQAQWSARNRKQVIYPISLLCLLVFIPASQAQPRTYRSKRLSLCAASGSTVRRWWLNGLCESLKEQQLDLISSPQRRWFFQQLVSAVDYLHKMVSCFQSLRCHMTEAELCHSPLGPDICYD